MADNTNTPAAPEMVERIAQALGDSFVPSNPYRLRDLFIWSLSTCNGPTTKEDRVWREHTINKWLREFATIMITNMREPTDQMIRSGDAAALSDGAHDCEVPMADVYRAMVDAALGK